MVTPGVLKSGRPHIAETHARKVTIPQIVGQDHDDIGTFVIMIGCVCDIGFRSDGNARRAAL